MCSSGCGGSALPILSRPCLAPGPRRLAVKPAQQVEYTDSMEDHSQLRGGQEEKLGLGSGGSVLHVMDESDQLVQFRVDSTGRVEYERRVSMPGINLQVLYFLDSGLDNTNKNVFQVK